MFFSYLHSYMSLFFIATAVLMVYLCMTLNVGYYTTADLLGPISKFPSIMIPLGTITGLSSFYVWRSDKLPKTHLYFPLVLFILYLFALPISSEKYIVTDFYDAPAHMARSMYVAETGRSSIHVDRYFDIQPGVFYSTSILMLITDVSPYIFMKWFPILFVVGIYIPALAFLGRAFFKDHKLSILYVFLTLAATWSTRYHYSAQIYSLPLFTLSIRTWRKRVVRVLPLQP